MIEDPAVFGPLPAPPGVDVTAWNTVSYHDWGRRAIRMVRPVYAYDPWKSFWEGSDPATGYDLLPVDPDPSHIDFEWVDGTPTKFSITNFPTASSQMRVFIDAGNPVDCFPCTNSTYDDWVDLGKPACWCEPFQCDGDADGVTETFFNYRIYGEDLNLVVKNWKRKINDPLLDPCADIDHKSETFFKYRVYGKDLAKTVANWKKKDTDLAGDCPRPE